MDLKHSSRRSFLGGIGAVSAWTLLNARPTEFATPSFEYVAGQEYIDVFRTEGALRIQIQTVASQRPCLLQDAARKLIFAVNRIDEFQGLPTGSIESYAIHPETGCLTLINRRSLSLSATMPRHLAISPDRQHVVVAVYGGGAYNVLPIHATGELGPVTQIIKEIGSSIHPYHQTAAHPHSVVFHPSGKFLLGTDLGSDRLNLFSFEDGHMRRLDQIQMPSGSGPARLTMNPSGSAVFVLHELTPLLSCYRFDERNGRILLHHHLPAAYPKIDKAYDGVLQFVTPSNFAGG